MAPMAARYTFGMRNATTLPIIILAAVVVGGLLYLYGGPAFHKSYVNQSPTAAFTPQMQPGLTTLASGDAPNVTGRVNYRITTDAQLAQLWQMLYTDSGQHVPNVDFNTYDVFALFDGSHSRGGYGIQLTSVNDSITQRTVTITHFIPSDSCPSSGGISSPFVIVEVSKSSLPINRIEQTAVNQCP